jgi:hypothetical protein
MVYGEASVMMMVMISYNSPSQQGARTEFLVPNRGFWWWRRNGSLSGKNVEPPLFSGQRPYVGKRRARGGGRGGYTTPWRGLAWPAPPGGVGPSWLFSVPSSGSASLLVKQEFCDIFCKFS